tara:strand:+ start:1117 stop:1656 length:540 start_codon:yes stop_codon:yes gene_type:complete
MTTTEFITTTATYKNESDYTKGKLIHESMVRLFDNAFGFAKAGYSYEEWLETTCAGVTVKAIVKEFYESLVEEDEKEAIKELEQVMGRLLSKKEPQPVDPYEGLELSEDVPTSEEINEALGVKEVCSFTEAVEANVAETKDFIPIKERQYTEEQKHFYWEAYHEGYKQGQAELNDIVNP